MANRFNRSIREIRDIEKQPLFTNEQNDLLSDINDDVYVRLRRRYERITGLPALEKKFQMHLIDYNQFKDDTQQMLIFLNNENERQDKMIDKLNTDVDELNKKAKRLKDITDEHTEKLNTLTNELNNFKTDIENNHEEVQAKLDELSSTLDTIQENDKEDKLKSEIDELRKTLDTLQSDIYQSQMFMELNNIRLNAKNFFSVSSNVTENVAGVKDHVYFDIYSILDSLGVLGVDVSISEQELNQDGSLSDEKKLVKEDDFTINQVNPNYLSVEIDTSQYEHIHIFTLKINDKTYHKTQVKFSDY